MIALMQPSVLLLNILYASAAWDRGGRCVITKEGSSLPSCGRGGGEEEEELFVGCGSGAGDKWSACPSDVRLCLVAVQGGRPRGARAACAASGSTAARQAATAPGTREGS